MHKKQQILTEQNTSQMNKRQYTTLTPQGKQYLFKGQQTTIKQSQPILSQKQNKFLDHFKSINNVDPITNMYSRSTHLNQDHQALYMTKLESYAQSKISQIERIIRSTDDENGIKPVRNDFKISPALQLIHVKPQIKRNVQRINDFFSIQEPKLTIAEKKEQEELFHTQILEIAAYSEILKHLPSKPKQQLKPQLPNFYSIYNTPTQRPIHEYQSPSVKMPFNPMNETQRYSTADRFGAIQINPTQNPQQMGNLTQPQIKFRKADMLLVEILREKKRKGLVPDYFKIMELKLFQLLDFVLQDQPQFEGLSSIEKMKQVLKKLQYFKGKKIEGQNKINLLKIFFEEFRNLKNQISQSEKKKPLQKVQNKPKPPAQKQQQPKQVKQVEKKAGHQSGIKKLPYRDTVSINGDKKQKGPASQAIKSVKGMEDEWMGDLQ